MRDIAKKKPNKYDNNQVEAVKISLHFLDMR